MNWVTRSLGKTGSAQVDGVSRGWTGGAAMTDEHDVLPDEIRALPLEEKIKRLLVFAPHKVEAVALLVTQALSNEWAKRFRAGPKGGLRLKGVPS